MIHQEEVNPRTGLRASSNEVVSPRNILVATDFSGASNRALEHALCLARTYNSQIFLAHVVPLDLTLAPEVAEATQERMRRAARAGMDEIRASKCFFAVPHQEIVREGPLWPNIAALIEKYNIDLMVVGTHGVGPVKKLLIGSSAEHIFRQARIPVLTVGPDVHREPLYEIELKNILFATAFGPGAERQAAYAFSLAQQHRSRITLLHVEEHAGQELAIVHGCRSWSRSRLICTASRCFAWSGETPSKRSCVRQKIRTQTSSFSAPKRRTAWLAMCLTLQPIKSSATLPARF